MAAYGTPGYDYAQGTSNLAQQKSAQDAASAYGRFMGQERFRRGQTQAQEGFRRQFPQVGQGFTQRGMFNSGLRKSGQRQFTQGYNDAIGNAQFEQAGAEQQAELEQASRNAQYQLALQRLYEQFQAGRASGYDPYAGVSAQIGGK